MDAEKYLKTKQRLSQALNGEEKLEELVTGIINTLSRYNLDVQPETAFDVMVFTLESLHLKNLQVSQFLL